MDGIKEVAKAYYEGRKEAEKELVKQFFHTIDTNGDGKVSLEEYKSKVDPCFSNQELFDELDSNRDGMLNFDEVLALYYMVQVSIPKCSSCHDLLTVSYFSCFPCQQKSSYYLCCNCYRAGKFEHEHSSAEFLDTGAMLKLLDELMKKATVTCQTAVCGVEQNDDAEDGQNIFTKLLFWNRSKAVVQNDTEGGRNIFKKLNLRNRSKANHVTTTAEAINSGITIGSALISIGSAVAVATTCSIM